VGPLGAQRVGVALSLFRLDLCCPPLLREAGWMVQDNNL
jgi:hypothetical protein